jgi:Rrf2 family protein
MRISRSTGYALLAVGYIAKNIDKKIILSQTISKEYDIPLEYLLKILQQLVRANVLRSKRGPRGGFSMSQKPTKISMLQIIEAVDGPLAGHYTLFEPPARGKYINKVEKIYSQAINQAKGVFQKTKLSELIK